MLRLHDLDGINLKRQSVYLLATFVTVVVIPDTDFAGYEVSLPYQVIYGSGRISRDKGFQRNKL